MTTMKRYDVAIVGAGTGGLSARREIAKLTDNYVVIDDGELGTTCARVGCMPSKVLIQVANDYHRRHALEAEGILGGESLSVDRKAVMRHVRSLRDRFVRGVLKGMESWTDTHLIRKRARFVDANTLDLGDEKIQANRFVLAPGSTPIVPGAWMPYRHRLIDTNAFFELEELPKRMAVIGLGVIGLELGQALARLGVEVQTVTLDKAYGGVSDPTLQDYVHNAFAKEMPIHLTAVKELSENEDGLQVHLADGTTFTVDAALLSMGRRSNVAGLGITEDNLKEIGLPEVAELLERGIPAFDANTFRVKHTPWYLVGDANNTRPLLHEAADEGRVAGYNAVREEQQCFRRRTPLAITFSEPNLAVIGEGHRELVARGADFVTGKVTYEGQGRAIVKQKELGLLHVYADRETGKILGSELFAPQGEHLAHLIAWAMAADLTVRQSLSLPFYHPVLEEGLRTALRDAAVQVNETPGDLEILRCEDPPVGVRA